MFALALLFAAQAPPPAIDQTNDIAIVARFLEALRADNFRTANALLAPAAKIRKYDSQLPTSLVSFAKYSEGCGLRAVLAGLPFVPTQRMDIQADWDCSAIGLTQVRQANFVIRENRIMEIRWGDLSKVPLPSVRWEKRPD